MKNIPECVEDAYKSSMQNCFMALVEGLMSANNEADKKKTIERFKRCLAINMEARNIYALLVQEN